MSYLADSMGEGEVIVLESRISLWMFTKEIVVLGLLLLLAYALRSPLVFVLAIVFGLIVYVGYSSAELAVTNKRVFAKFGFISRKVVEVRSSKVEGLTIDQSFVGRIFGFGTIVITGTGGISVPIPYVREPLDFRRAVDSVTTS